MTDLARLSDHCLATLALAAQTRREMAPDLYAALGTAVAQERQRRLDGTGALARRGRTSAPLENAQGLRIFSAEMRR